MFLSIDLGSNTLRFALIDENLRQIKVYENIIGAAREFNITGKISDQAKKELYKSLKNANEIFDFKSVENQGVATGAWRVASNGVEILNEIKAKFGLNFCVISGKSEAELTFLGVKNALKRENIDLKSCAFIDLGGASTEIGDGKNFQSFELGIITFYEKFQEFLQMKSGAKIMCEKAKIFLNSLNANRVILTSGVPTTMVAYKLGQTYYDYNPSQINGAKIKFDEFDSFCSEILQLPSKQADEIFGKNRQMLLVAGGVILSEILSNSNAELIVIDDGLREGVAVAQNEGNLSEILVKS